MGTATLHRPPWTGGHERRSPGKRPRRALVAVLTVLSGAALAASLAALDTPRVRARTSPAPSPTVTPVARRTPAPSATPGPTRPPATPAATGQPVAGPVVPLPRLEGAVALTFDDGPHPRYTSQVLDVLDAHGVKATFFVVGQEAERHPDLVRSIVARGHVVAGHTWSHARLTGLDEASFSAQVDRANDLLTELTGQSIRCVRPPGGAYDSTTVSRLQARGLELTMWTHDTRDWSKPAPSTIISRATESLNPGSIVLFHDGGGDRSRTVEALPSIIQRMQTAGASIAPVCAAS